MLGHVLRDPLHIESRIPEIAGMDLLDMEVTFTPEKTTIQSTGLITCNECWLQGLNGTILDGYEIHAGQNKYGAECIPWLKINGSINGVCNNSGNVIGCYLHGLFDDGQFFAALAAHVRRNKGTDGTTEHILTMAEYREQEFDRIASIVRASVDMDTIYKIISGEV